MGEHLGGRGLWREWFVYYGSFPFIEQEKERKASKESNQRTEAEDGTQEMGV